MYFYSYIVPLTWFPYVPLIFSRNFKPMATLLVQHAKLGKWKLLALIWLLTCPLVVLQVPVVPCSKPPDCQLGTKSCDWRVSSEGRCKDSRGRISHGYLRASGYCVVNIRGHICRVHRLVAHAFHGLPLGEAAWQVNHIDGNCSNNRFDNLEWVTPSQNVRHSYANLRRHSSGPSRGRSTMRRPRGEEWRPMKCPRSGLLVPGRAVSSWGRIRSKRGHVSFGCILKEGYLRTKFTLGSQRRQEYVHRLVATAFLGLPPSPEHSQINHKDGNKSNNAVDNLEYVTPAENNAHRCANLKGPHPLSKPVLSRAYGTKEEWTAHASGTSAAETLGLDRSEVSRCACGLPKHSRGYEFRLAEPEPCVVETLPGEVWFAVDLEAHLQDREKRKIRASSHPWRQEPRLVQDHLGPKSLSAMEVVFNASWTWFFSMYPQRSRKTISLIIRFEVPQPVLDYASHQFARLCGPSCGCAFFPSPGFPDQLMFAIFSQYIAII